MNKTILKGWVARDQYGDIRFYKNKPYRDLNRQPHLWINNDKWSIWLWGCVLPEVTWEDKEPTEVKIIFEPKCKRRKITFWCTIALKVKQLIAKWRLLGAKKQITQHTENS